MYNVLLKKEEDHEAKITKPHFLLSAQNPKFPSRDKLKLTHDQALNHLKSQGHDAHSVNGHYGSPEKSIVVYGPKKEHIKKLHQFAADMGQDSSIHSNGQKHEIHFHHGADKGKVIHGEGTTFHTKKPKDLYTTLPNGKHFTHNFHFSKSETLNKAEDSEKVNLVHYSQHPNLKEVDPKFKGTGADSRTKSRDTWHPHSFFYREGTKPEEDIANHTAHKYKATVDAKKLYDLGTDVHKLDTTPNMDDTHEKIKAKGYHGFHNSASALPHVVAMYHPTKVEKDTDVKKSEGFGLSLKKMIELDPNLLQKHEKAVALRGQAFRKYVEDNKELTKILLERLK